MLFSFTLPISTIRKDVSPLTTRVRNIRSFNGCSSRALDKGTLLRSHLIVYVLTLYSVDPTSANSIISSSIIPTSSRLRSRDTKMRSRQVRKGGSELEVRTLGLRSRTVLWNAREPGLSAAFVLNSCALGEMVANFGSCG